MLSAPIPIHRKLQPYLDHTLSFLLRRLKNHHTPSYQHTVLAAELSLLFAEATGMGEYEKRSFVRSVLTHDLGHLHLHKDCLKNYLIDRQAWDTYKQHPILSMRIAEQFQIDHISEEIVLYHHEHLDGSGFPFRLKWEELCYEVRVLTIIDAFASIAQETPNWTSRIEELYIWNDIMFDKEILEHMTTMVQLTQFLSK